MGENAKFARMVLNPHGDSMLIPVRTDDLDTSKAIDIEHVGDAGDSHRLARLLDVEDYVTEDELMAATPNKYKLISGRTLTAAEESGKGRQEKETESKR